ncbi:hypothetical protein ACTFIZ_011348 [Dictyostelium cf. discoideum]
MYQFLNIPYEHESITYVYMLPVLFFYRLILNLKSMQIIIIKKKKMSTFADLRSVSGALLGGMGSIGYFIYTSEIGSVDFYIGVGFASFGCLLVSDHYSK